MAVTGRSRDGVNPTQCGNNETTTGLLCSVATDSGFSPPLTSKAIFNSWINDGTDVGIRIEWTTAPPTAWLIKCVLFGGSGFSNAYGSSFNTTGVLDTAITITDPNFPPDLVFLISHNSSINDTANSFLGAMFGFAINDGSNTQGSISIFEPTGATPSAAVANCCDRSAFKYGPSTGGGPEARVEEFSAVGFKIYQRVGGTPDIEGIYFALKFNPSAGLAAKVLTDATPTSGTTDMITGAGWTPQFGMGLYVAQPTASFNAGSVDSPGCESFGVGMFTANAQACASIWIDDAANPSNTESLIDSKPMNIRNGAAAFLVGTLVGFNSDGAEFNDSTVQGTAYARRFLFIKAGVSGHPATLRRQQIPGMKYARGGF